MDLIVKNLLILLKLLLKSQYNSEKELDSKQLFIKHKNFKNTLMHNQSLIMNFQKITTGEILEVIISWMMLEINHTVDLAILFHLHKLSKIDLKLNMEKVFQCFLHNLWWCATTWMKVVMEVGLYSMDILENKDI